MTSTPRQSTQEIFWQQEFGSEYTERNIIPYQQRLPFFQKILSKTFGVSSVCELGSNRGHNLEAIHELSKNYSLTAVEINPDACKILSNLSFIETFNSSILEFNVSQTYDLVFTSGVLIHINPSDLPHVYQKMYERSNRYILLNEYFNPVPVEIPYRGHSGKLFKRDFAFDFVQQYPKNLKLLDTGFLWRHDNPVWDDTCWFLFEKI